MNRGAPQGTSVCPECLLSGPLLLAPGQRCTQCESQRAWLRVEQGGRLIIDKATIAAAEARRAGEAAGEGWLKRALLFIPVAASLLLSVAACVAMWNLGRSRPLDAPDRLVATLSLAASETLVAGIIAFAAGLFGLRFLGRRRHFRRLDLLVPYSVAVVIGAVAATAGGSARLGATRALDLQYLSMPTPTVLAVPAPQIQRIMGATAIILAPDENGDASNMSIGTGAIIAKDATRAWLITCRHVVMPWAAVAAWHSPSEAQPLWIQLSDGRSAPGKVRWLARPPLDVALVEVGLPNAPEPVPISPASGGLHADSPVSFVPNPFRSGWHVHHGAVIEREVHKTPAGEVSLLVTNLPVQPGDSGSGLFDEFGRLVGLNTWLKIDDSGHHGISLPTETMRAIVSALERSAPESLDALVSPHRTKDEPQLEKRQERP